MLGQELNPESVEQGGVTKEYIREADARRDAEQWKDAADLYAAALALDPKLTKIWVQYGNMLKEAGWLQEAENAYSRALELDDAADTHLQLGHLHKVMRRSRDAERDYFRALELDPNLVDARRELTRLGWSAARLRKHLLRNSANTISSQKVVIALELSDLIDFLQDKRYPTGIQRVQLELAREFVESNDFEDHFVYYDHGKYRFIEVDAAQVRGIIDLVEDSRRNEESRREHARRLKGDILDSATFDFPEGTYLVNVGTSWGYWNYFLSIRDLQIRANLRYVPLVHDCIPILFPEYCNPNLVCDFINWICGMMRHAEIVLTNSENTRADVIKVADTLGEALPRIVTVPLNGLHSSAAGIETVCKSATVAEALKAENLDVEDFVLFVSTIEPRKNHTVALNAWSRLLKTRPVGSVPRLVCVGNSGWMNEAIYQRLEHDRALRERVIIMHNVPDQTLQALYSRCLFTLFPSQYEGWGLPISEALAFGKVPLVSHVSSHPEAGGEFAVYFDLNAETDFQAKLESLIYNSTYRRELEKKIEGARPLRPWSEIAADIRNAVEGNRQAVVKRADGEKRPSSPVIATGRYYSFARNLESSLSNVNYSGDMYRAGTSWHPPEPWGCWVAGNSAEITFCLPNEEGNEFLLYVHWTGSSLSDNQVIFSAPPSNWTRRVDVKRGEDRWEIVPFQFADDSSRQFRFRIRCDKVDDFSIPTEGKDPRIASVGARGIYVCRQSDTFQRMAIMEAIQLKNLNLVSRRVESLAHL